MKGRGRQGSGGQPTPGAGQRDPAHHGGVCVGQGAASGWPGPLAAPHVTQGGVPSPSRASEEAGEMPESGDAHNCVLRVHYLL